MTEQIDVTFVRIYLHEADHGRRHALMQEILSALGKQPQVHGVTVLRGIAGIGADGEVMAEDLLRLTVDLPLVVEFYEEPGTGPGVIDALGGLVAGHTVLSWPARLTVPGADAVP